MKLYLFDHLRKRALEATDGEIGRCVDGLFDRRHWTLRYLVVDTRKWLPGRKVVISPASVAPTALLNQEGQIKVQLSRAQIRQSPPVEEHAPVSMQVEEQLSQYYGWPSYWAGANPWGDSATTPLAGAARASGRGRAFEVEPTERDLAGQTSVALHSLHEIGGYRVQATDGDLAHLVDFAFDPEHWTLRFGILKTGHWLSGRRLAILPEWIERFDVIDRNVFVSRARASLEKCPEVDESATVLSEAEVEALEAALPGDAAPPLH
jgi:hypothetical protein